MAETRTQQRANARLAANREQARRGVAAATTVGRAAMPIPAAGGRGRRGAGSVITFVRDVRSELRKVVWPTSREAVNLTIVVLALSIVIGLFLGGVDFIFQELFRWLLALAGSGGL